MNREHIRKEFQNYTQPYNPKDPKIQLKIAHTYRVCGFADRIAESLGLSEADRDLAWTLGMLHDIGRFEQVRRYGTFVDAQSVDHAELGADLLFWEGLIRRFVPDQNEDVLMEKAIRLHSVFALPEDLTDRERMFCQILRDADKIDIMRVNCDFSLPEIYNLPEEAFRTSAITDEVYEDALSCRNVLRSHRKTAIDFVIGQICLAFGLVYPLSRQIVKEQGYLQKLLETESENPDTVQKMQVIREKVQTFLGA